MRVNTTLLEFYWKLGKDIVEKEKNASWRSGFLNQVSKDLTKEFPNMKGFSKNNLQYIKRWHLYYVNNESINMEQLVPQLVKIPWGHNLKIISKSKSSEEAIFYVNKTIENN